MATAVRSPSPGPAARACCAMRRSADSITASASPSDPPQRSSSVSRSAGGFGGHASPRAFCAEKENELRDAVRTTPKARAGGAKNFMAPTISAASKAVAASASPRKKVLGERNEQQHSVPSSPGELAQKPKGPPEACAGARGLRLSFEGAPAPPAPAPEASHGSRHSFGGGEAGMEKPVCKNHHDAAGVAAVSVDAEPSQAALLYDPKTNYLSPRPRFLHYKPNPRIEMYRHGGGNGVRRLEDGFASESSEETETTTTTTEDELTEEEQEQAHHSSVPDEPSALAPPSEAGEEAAVPAEACVLPPEQALHSSVPDEPSALAAPSEVVDEAAVPAEACVLPPEPAPDSPWALVLTPKPTASSPRAHVLTPEPRATSPRARAVTPEPEIGASTARTRAKKSSLRFLFVPVALVVLFVAAAFIYAPPPPNSPLMSNTALSKVSDFLSVQELHPVELAAWLKQWSSSSFDSIASYWEALASKQEQEFFGPHFAANLSAAAVDADHDVDLYYNFGETLPMPSEESIGASVLEQDLTIQDVVSASNTQLIAEVEFAGVGDAVVEEELNEYGDGSVVEELNVEMSEQISGSNGEEMISFSQNLDIPSQPTEEPEQMENLENSDTSLQQDVESDESEADHANGKEDQDVYHGLKSELSMWPAYLDKISKPVAVGVALAAAVVSTVMAFLYMRQKQAQVASDANALAEQTVQAETHSGSGSSEGHPLVKGTKFQSSVAEETERFGGSGVSQYSSSLSSGHGRRTAKQEESMNLEPMSKRESMAYSTSSYGSFTTYEKISAKKRSKEDEAMTPVRRSSRLRSQVKSPEA